MVRRYGKLGITKFGDVSVIVMEYSQTMKKVEEGLSVATIQSQPDQGFDSRSAKDLPLPGVWVERHADVQDEAVVLYVYGGTFVLNRGPMHEVITGKIAMHGRARVLCCDYRLAPENPFPAAIEDIAAVYETLLDQGHDPRKIVLMGDTAGCAIALSALLLLRERDICLPAGFVALCPIADLTFSGGSYVRNFRGGDKVSELEILAMLSGDYLQGEDPRAPLASPVFAELGGMPPTQIHVDVNEVHCDDGVMLAERMRGCGCRVEFHQSDGLPSTWQKLAPLSSAASAALIRIGQFVRSQCRPPDVIPKDEAIAEEFVNIFDGHVQPHMTERVKQIMDWSVDHGPAWVWPFMERRLGQGSLVTQEQCEREWLYKLFARSSDAVFLLSSSRHVLLTNEPADAMCEGDNLFMQRHGRLQGVTQDVDIFLQNAFAELAAEASPVSFPLVGVGDVRFFARLEQLNSDEAEVIAPPVTLLTIATSKKKPSIDERALRAWFGLSEREACLAATFAEGTSLADYAAAEGLSMNTVRTQFAHIRAKLGAVDQADVVRQILQVSNSGWL
tara:strand:- start:150 stop:1829 length:1680 start_codon:yes stop_codon:yes gene_type:complete